MMHTTTVDVHTYNIVAGHIVSSFVRYTSVDLADICLCMSRACVSNCLSKEEIPGFRIPLKRRVLYIKGKFVFLLRKEC